mgnify:FL=1|tara:strand:+ start:47084 stop:47404 length:321 start_codon:yes stop_codon:yes gene_type:complete
MNISCHIKKLSLLLFIGFTFFSCKKEEKSTVTINEIMVRAPFDKPSIKIPDFSKSPKISILEFGAVSGDKNKNALAIERAIEKANAIGGGIVIIPEGEEWITKKYT